MQSPEIFFLGTGNAFNAGGQANQAILIKSQAAVYLVDAGPNIMLQLQKYGINPASIDYLLLTHFHGDHTAGIPFLLLYYWEFAKDHKITICGPKGTKLCCERLLEAAYPTLDMGQFALYQEWSRSFGSPYSLAGEDKVSLHYMDHSPESTGYRLNLGGYIVSITGDTRWCEEIFPLVKGAHGAIIECTTVKKSEHAHISVEEFSENIEKLETELVIPVHTYPEVLRALKKISSKKLKMVIDGDKILLPPL